MFHRGPHAENIPHAYCGTRRAFRTRSEFFAAGEGALWRAVLRIRTRGQSSSPNKVTGETWDDDEIWYTGETIQEMFHRGPHAKNVSPADRAQKMFHRGPYAKNVSPLSRG